MKTKISMALAVFSALLFSSCVWSGETDFFSNFSLRQLVQRSQSSTGFNCEASTGGGGGGGISTRTGGIGFGGSRFSSQKSDRVACRLKSETSEDFETRLLEELKVQVQQSLRNSGAEITEKGSPNPATFYFAYTLKAVRGRVQVSGARIGTDYYDVHASLEESGS